jgi:hypothetical protein
MYLNKIFLVLLLCLNSLVNAQEIKLKNVSVINADFNGWIEHQDITIKDGIIQKIGPTSYRHGRESKKYVIPGLIDAHVHFFQSAGIYGRPDVINKPELRTYADETKWLRSQWKDWLEVYASLGITTVVDVAGPLWNLDVKKMSLENPKAARVFVAGPLISTYDSKELIAPDSPIVYVATPEEVKQEVLREVKAGVDIIKVWYIPTGQNSNKVSDVEDRLKMARLRRPMSMVKLPPFMRRG